MSPWLLFFSLSSFFSPLHACLHLSPQGSFPATCFFHTSLIVFWWQQCQHSPHPHTHTHTSSIPPPVILIALSPHHPAPLLLKGSFLLAFLHAWQADRFAKIFMRNVAGYALNRKKVCRGQPRTNKRWREAFIVYPSRDDCIAWQITEGNRFLNFAFKNIFFDLSGDIIMSRSPTLFKLRT